MTRDSRSSVTVLLWAALALVIIVYRDTLLSMVRTWHDNSTFSHGFLIVPISAWLAWRKRGELAGVARRPAWTGALAVLAAVLAWVVGRGVGTIGVEQFAVVAMVPAVVLAIGGWPLTWLLAMPLGYLVLAVPVGHALIPWLMRVTADVATWVLQLTGVPVMRSNMYITVPAGSFEVARACSGLNYTVTGIALGALYSYLTYRGWRKRVLSMVAFVVVPIVANGLRVYFTILVSYLTDMRFGPGQEHVWFGRVFFILVMLAMFWVGRRWADEEAPQSPAARRAVEQGSMTPAAWLPALVAVLTLLGGPLYLASAEGRVEARLRQEVDRLQLVSGGQGWSGPVYDAASWRPLYSGARVERGGRYEDASGARVDVYVGVYGIGTSGGAEMISYRNRIFAEEHRSLGNARTRAVPLGDGGTLEVRELQVQDGREPRLVWYWYMVGDRRLTSPYLVKAQEAVSFVTLGAVTERVLTVSTVVDGREQRRLSRFVADHARCVAAGFAFEACGR